MLVRGPEEITHIYIPIYIIYLYQPSPATFPLKSHYLDPPWRRQISSSLHSWDFLEMVPNTPKKQSLECGTPMYKANNKHPSTIPKITIFIYFYGINRRTIPKWWKPRSSREETIRQVQPAAKPRPPTEPPSACPIFGE